MMRGLESVELPKLADWISGDVNAVMTETGIRDRLAIMAARFIAEGLAERQRRDPSRDPWSPFTWSEIFTSSEIELGAINVVPDWFVEGKSPLATDLQSLSKRFIETFVGPYLLCKTFVIATHARQSSMAAYLREMGVQPGAKLVAEHTGDTCTITAIGRCAVFGVWSRVGGNADAVSPFEEKLNLTHTNFVVHQ